MKQLYRSLVLTTAILAGVAAALVSPSSLRANPDSCATTKFTFPQVQKACDEGGLRGAKNLMKESVKRAKAAGKDYKCSTCHQNQKTFELKKDAAEMLKPYI